MTSGGPRQGAPGKTYANRSDMNAGPRTQPVRAASGQPYGARKAQEEAQRALPLPEQSIVPLGAPTTRPGEPVTAGLPVGPGPGPEALNLPLQPSLADMVRAALVEYQIPALQAVLDMLEGR